MIFAVATDERVPRAVPPCVIGATVFAGALVTGPLTGGSFNPARSLGPAVAGGGWTAHWRYWAAPIVGMVAAARLFEALRGAHPPAATPPGMVRLAWRSGSRGRSIPTSSGARSEEPGAYPGARPVNTPTHAVLSVALLARRARRSVLAPALVGAVLPDVPMYVLFAVATFVWHQPQAVTWGQTYFEPGWQHAVDALHSFPLLGAALAATFAPQCMQGLGGAGAAGGAPRAPAWCAWARIALASALLHAGTDVLVHADDAHHHLWPLSDWRFVSPVSYWDPRHHGLVFAPLECLGALALLPAVWQASRRRAARGVLLLLAAVYAAGAALGLARLASGAARPGPGSLQGALTTHR